MVKNIFDDLAPAQAMEKARVGAAIDKGFPSLRIADVECADDHGMLGGPADGRLYRCGLHQLPPSKKT
jgi:hypothetical protein